MRCSRTWSAYCTERASIEPGGQSRTWRSASLAQFSLTHTRSWAANGFNARIRLKAENDRLRQELALLQEEMRIKDARMQRIPAQRRPHYPPIERLAILELRAARAWSISARMSSKPWRASLR